MTAAPKEAFPAGDETAAVRWLDARIAERRDDELMPVVREHIGKEKRPQVQWRLAQATMGYYERHRDAPDDEKLRAYSSVERVTRDCVARGGPPYCDFFLGASLGRQGTVQGMMKSLGVVKGIEKSLLVGLAKATNRPDLTLDGAALESYFHYTLGALYRILPDWKMVEFVAGVRGDLDKAIGHLRKAVAMRPDVATTLELGLALMCSGDRRDNAAHMKEGKDLLNRVLAMPRDSEFAQTDQQAARDILKRPANACGYSRDKMQDVDSKP